MLPNTFDMQINGRQAFDWMTEAQEDGKSVETPHVYTITKGMYKITCFIQCQGKITEFLTRNPDSRDLETPSWQGRGFCAATISENVT